MTRNDSTRTTSSEGAPGLPMLVFLGVLFVAAVVSTWVVYEKVPATSFFGGMRSGVSMPPPGMGYTSSGAVLHSVPSPGATGVPTADVEFGIEWNTWDWNTANLVGSIVYATLQRAASGSAVLDSEVNTLATTAGAIDQRYRWRAFEGPFETLTSQQRAAIADDLATALGPFFQTPGFDGIVRIELCFVAPDGTFERFEILRDPVDTTVLVARPLTK